MVRGIRKILRLEAETRAGAVAASLAAGNRTMEGVTIVKLDAGLVG